MVDQAGISQTGVVEGQKKERNRDSAQAAEVDFGTIEVAFVLFYKGSGVVPLRRVA